ncbi:MAG: amidohydrolase family protein, partial [Clostridia bacterium]|nr:amidohydrolase family protein [Clostridia bacterium]
MGRYVLKNGKVILANKLIDNGGVVVEGKYIKDIFSGDNNISYGQDYQVIDVKGKYISPGFIDIHVHGGANSDFLDGSQDAIKDILKLHAQNGTTSLLATTLTCSDKDLFNALDNIRIAIDNDYDGAKILGVHLEGPYFSPKEKGAQDPKYIRNPVRDEYVSIIKKYPGMIKRVSAAPELKGSLEMAKYLSSKNILVSMAHTDATYDQAIEGVDNGFSHITHIYNSTSSVRSRDFYCQAGVVEAGLSLDELTVEVIADGRHI